MKRMKGLIKAVLVSVFMILVYLGMNCSEVNAAESVICDPIEVEVCDICGRQYYGGGCPHWKGEVYDAEECAPREGELCNICHSDFSHCTHQSGEEYGGIECNPWSKCNICGNNYDDGSVCSHHAGEDYGGVQCTTSIIRICNICDYDYDDGSVCTHLRGALYDEGYCETEPVEICNICGRRYYNDGCPHWVGEWYDSQVCEPVLTCNICDRPYINGGCPHWVDESYGGKVCESYEGRICNICGNDYDDGYWCPHHIGESYDGVQCTTTTYKKCNVCGNNYYDSSVCSHKEGTAYDTGLFIETDFELNEEVQQLITYYDDMYLYSETAYELGIIGVEENRCLQEECRTRVDTLRRNNYIEEDDDNWLDTMLFVGGFVPYIGGVFDILSDPMTVQAGTLDRMAMDKINDNQDTIIDDIARKAVNRYKVYELVDEDGVVRYVGRTRQTLKVREWQHHYTDPNKRGLTIRAAKIGEYELDNLNYAEARGLEQKVYERAGGDAAVKQGTLLNRIRPLAKEKVAKYADVVADFIKKIS